jgi:hypothetical protein
MAQYRGGIEKTKELMGTLAQMKLKPREKMKLKVSAKNSKNPVKKGASVRNA